MKMMKRRTQLVALLGVGSALLAGGVAQAQQRGMQGMQGGPGMAGGPGMGPSMAGPGMEGGSAAAGNGSELGTVSNDTTTDTTIEQTGFEDTSLPNTGGEPWLMALGGSFAAAGALFLRRRLS